MDRDLVGVGSWADDVPTIPGSDLDLDLPNTAPSMSSLLPQTSTGTSPLTHAYVNSPSASQPWTPAKPGTH